MNIFQILSNLFCNPKSDWILDLEEEHIQPKIIHDYLSMCNKSIKQAAIVNKFVYVLPPKMYLSAVWSILFFNGKKLNKAPFIKYKGKKKGKERFWFLHEKIQRHLKMSDTDLKYNQELIDKEIDKDKPKWFAFYGIQKQHWDNYSIDFNLMKEVNKREENKKKDLFNFMGG